MKPHTWRSLRRDNNTFFLTPTAAMKRTLCSGCNNTDCDKPKQQSRCATFRPTLIFQDRTGLDYPLFNTIRMGAAAAERYRPGDKIALSDGFSVFALAQVKETRVITNTVEGLATVARENHLYIGQHMSSGVAAMALVDALRKIYGPHILNSYTELTAVYLTPVV